MDTSRTQIRVVSGGDVARYVPSLAELRIAVFREFPYLYEGTLDYESDYLLAYARSKRSVFVLAFDGEQVVGVSTGVPMTDADTDFREPFEQQGYEVERIFYFGESVLLPAYRGSGLGSRFMNERESFAKALGGFDCCTFCAVQRPSDHPLRPEGYFDLGGFWRKYGFVEQLGLQTSFSWRELGELEESPKTMRFWVKKI